MNDLSTFSELDVVVLVMDLPAERLRKGSLGTIVEVFDDNTYMVEFADMNGVAYALPLLSGQELMKVYQEPVIA